MTTVTRFSEQQKRNDDHGWRGYESGWVVGATWQQPARQGGKRIERKTLMQMLKRVVISIAGH